MHRREFVVAGLCAVPGLVVPRLGGARSPGASLCLIDDRGLNTAGLRGLHAQGRRVRQVAAMPASVWYDHLAPALERGVRVETLFDPATSFLVHCFAALDARVRPATALADIAREAGLDALAFSPRAAIGREGRA